MLQFVFSIYRLNCEIEQKIEIKRYFTDVGQNLFKVKAAVAAFWANVVIN